MGNGAFERQDWLFLGRIRSMPRLRTFAELPIGTKFRFAGKILIKRNKQIAKDENNHDYIFAGESESLSVEPLPAKWH